MKDTLEPFIDGIRDVRTLDDLSSEILRLRDVLDAEHVVYHSVNSTGEQYAALTYSSDWVQRYLDADYARIDPVVQGCFRRFDPVDWGALDWSGRRVRDFMGEAQDAGIGQHGMSVPVRGPSGQFALFTVNQNGPERTWDAYAREHRHSVLLAAHFINQKALEIERGTDLVEGPSLSPRETDSLRMLALGYSRARAADSLSISEHTLRVYIESARDKLGAANTTHAVARALSSGLIIV